MKIYAIIPSGFAKPFNSYQTLVLETSKSFPRLVAARAKWNNILRILRNAYDPGSVTPEVFARIIAMDEPVRKNDQVAFNAGKFARIFQRANELNPGTNNVAAIALDNPTGYSFGDADESETPPPVTHDFL